MIRIVRHSVSLVSFAALSLAFAALTGCSSAPSSSGGDATGSTAVEQATSGNTANASSLCSVYCAKMSSCDSTIDSDTCAVKCEDEVGDSLGRANPTITEGTAICIQKADCATALQGNLPATCNSAAAAEVAPSSTAESFCNAYKSAAATCDVTLDLGDCINNAKQYSDAILNQAGSCTKKTCDAMGDCIDAVLGVVDSDSSSDSSGS